MGPFATLNSVFKRFGDLSNALAASGATFMTSEELGYLKTSPLNLGTALRASVMVQLKKFNELLENKDSSHEDPDHPNSVGKER